MKTRCKSNGHTMNSRQKSRRNKLKFRDITNVKESKQNKKQNNKNKMKVDSLITKEKKDDIKHKNQIIDGVENQIIDDGVDNKLINPPLGAKPSRLKKFRGQRASQVRRYRKRAEINRRKFLKHYQDLLVPFLADNAKVRKIFASTHISSILPNRAYIMNTPEYIKFGKLRDYQTAGVNWIIQKFDSGVGCILGDEMGLGKTIQTLAFLSYLKQERNLSGPHLVIVPLSVCLNWINEIKRWTPNLTWIKVQGGKAERDDILTRWDVALGTFDITITTYETILSEFDYFKSIKWLTIVIDEAHKMRSCKSRFSINMNELKCPFKLMLTGTPLQNNLHELGCVLQFLLPKTEIGLDLQKFLDAFVLANSQFDQDMIKKAAALLDVLMIRRTKEEVEPDLPQKTEIPVFIPLNKIQNKWYKRLINKEKIFEGILNANQMLHVIMQLRKVCNHPNMLTYKTTSSRNAERLKMYKNEKIKQQQKSKLNYGPDTEDEEDEEDEKESKQNTQQKIVKVNDPAGIDILKNAEYPGEVTKKKLEFGVSIPYTDIVIVVIDHPNRIISDNNDDSRLQTNEDGNTLNTIEISFYKLADNSGWIHNYNPNQPDCMDRIVEDEPGDEELEKKFKERKKEKEEKKLLKGTAFDELLCISEEKLLEASNKMNLFHKLVIHLKKGGHRVLVFSQFTIMLDILQKYVEWQGFMWKRLDGQTNRIIRELDVRDFNAKDSPFFIYLISTKAGGLGLNLATADSVIIFDSDWNPQNDLQAIARAHRIGQTKPVTIYRLISEETVEERIVQRAQQKLCLDRIVVGKNQIDRRKASVKEMLSMLAYGYGKQLSSEGTDIDHLSLEKILERSHKHVLACKKKVEARRDDAESNHLLPKLIAQTQQTKELDEKMTNCINCGKGNCLQYNQKDCKFCHYPILEKPKSPSYFKVDQHLARTKRKRKPNSLFIPDDWRLDEKQKKPKIRHEEKCFMCKDGGMLIQCVGCPKVYHPACVSLKRVPKGVWTCPWHECCICLKKKSKVGGIMFRCVRCPNSYCFNDWPEQCPRYKKEEPVAAEIIKKLNWRNYDPVGTEYCLCAECKAEDDQKEKEKQDKIEAKRQLLIQKEIKRQEKIKKAEMKRKQREEEQRIKQQQRERLFQERQAIKKKKMEMLQKLRQEKQAQREAEKKKKEEEKERIRMEKQAQKELEKREQIKEYLTKKLDRIPTAMEVDTEIIENEKKRKAVIEKKRINKEIKEQEIKNTVSKKLKEKLGREPTTEELENAIAKHLKKIFEERLKKRITFQKEKERYQALALDAMKLKLGRRVKPTPEQIEEAMKEGAVLYTKARKKACQEFRKKKKIEQEKQDLMLKKLRREKKKPKLFHVQDILNHVNQTIAVDKMVDFCFIKMKASWLPKEHHLQPGINISSLEFKTWIQNLKQFKETLVEKKKQRQITKKKKKEEAAQKNKTKLQKVENIIEYLEKDKDIDLTTLDIKLSVLPEEYHLPVNVVVGSENWNLWRTKFNTFREVLTEKKKKRQQLYKINNLKKKKKIAELQQADTIIECSDNQHKVVQKKKLSQLERVKEIIKYVDNESETVDLTTVKKKLSSLPEKYNLPTDVVVGSQEWNLWYTKFNSFKKSLERKKKYESELYKKRKEKEEKNTKELKRKEEEQEKNTKELKRKKKEEKEENTKDLKKRKKEEEKEENTKLKKKRKKEKIFFL